MRRTKSSDLFGPPARDQRSICDWCWHGQHEGCPDGRSWQRDGETYRYTCLCRVCHS